MTAEGNTGNVISALASFFIPGLGQLLQARVMPALFFFVTVSICYALWWTIVLLVVGALLHLWCILDAATFRPTEP